MEVIRHAELIVEWFLLYTYCMPDEARDGRNVAFELSSELLVCSIVQSKGTILLLV